jgi:histidinol-phosphatase (PHP family)
MVDHPDYPVWQTYSVADVWRLYFEELRAAAGSRLYDVMAHPDLPKVFGERPPGGVPQREYDDTADAFAAAGVACEISSAGLRKAAGELYPAPAFLEACAARDVPITLAADAHRPEDVGRGLEHAVRLATDAGYRTVTAFRGREPRQEPLG